MKKTILILFIFFISGCGTIPFQIVSHPQNRSETQQQLDNLECTNMSRVEGPCLFGIGLLMYRSMSADKYKHCMTSKGYVVVPQK